MRAASCYQLLPQDIHGRGIYTFIPTASGEYEVVQVDGQAGPTDSVYLQGRTDEIDALRLGDLTASRTDLSLHSLGRYGSREDGWLSAIAYAFDDGHVFNAHERAMCVLKLLRPEFL